MSSKRMCLVIRAAVLAVALCVLALVIVFPFYLLDGVHYFQMPAAWVLPWALFIFAASLPVFGVLIIIWRGGGAVARQEVFSMQSAGEIELAGKLLVLDAAFFFVGNIVLILFNMNHPGIVLIAVGVCILALAFGMICRVLGQHVRRATALQEEADATI